MLNRLPKQLVVKTTVWVAVAMLALQPMSSFACDGSADANQGCSGDSGRANDKAVQGARCCSARKARVSVSSGCCESKKRVARGCCSSGQELAAPFTDDCSCGLSCSCKSNRVPPLPVATPTNGNTGSDQLANMHASVSSRVVEVFDSRSGISRRQVDGTEPATSLERCIGLSCFLL